MKFTLLTKHPHFHRIGHFSTFDNSLLSIFKDEIQCPIARHGIIHLPVIKAICPLGQVLVIRRRMVSHILPWHTRIQLQKVVVGDSISTIGLLHPYPRGEVIKGYLRSRPWNWVIFRFGLRVSHTVISFSA